MKKYLIILFFHFIALSSSLAEQIKSIDIDEENHIFSSSKDTKKESVLHQIGDVFTDIFKSFNQIDTTYIEPQRYNYSAMLQSVTNIESFRFSTEDGQSVTFMPKSKVKIGPYFGWRWVFLGYTFDINKIHLKNNHRDINLSLYSSLVNFDIYWRESGDIYYIRRAKLTHDGEPDVFHNLSFNGLSTSIKGFNLNYIFNHKKFSYPAAFSQSTCQRKSAGSVIAGIGFSRHKLSLDYDKLSSVLVKEMEEKHPDKKGELKIDSTLNFSSIRLKAYSASCGYAYNWVVAKNFLLAASLTAGVAFRRTTGDMKKQDFTLRDFNVSNAVLNSCGRFGFVYNNTRWYAGTSNIVQYYSFQTGRFHTSSMFLTSNIYVGYNFGKK